MFIVECNSIVFVTVGAMFVALCSIVYWAREQVPGQRSALHNKELMICIPGIIKTVKSLHVHRWQWGRGGVTPLIFDLGSSSW